uniref:LIM and calponin homology domains 1 n=1 Tax=Myotis myotis TaxID=51298 RepID=A0A7J8ALE3_MYOMY|nr:LIM and calponin homology domains 1 [Myotis myotis]
MTCLPGGLLTVSRNQQCLLTSTSRTKATRRPMSPLLCERRGQSERSIGRAGAPPPPRWVARGPSDTVRELLCLMTQRARVCLTCGVRRRLQCSRTAGPARSSCS